MRYEIYERKTGRLFEVRYDVVNYVLKDGKHHLYFENTEYKILPYEHCQVFITK